MCCPKKGDKIQPLSEVEKNRTCTDFFCYIIFVLFVAAMVWATIYGMIKGDLSKLAQPYDVDSNPCGKGELAKFKYQFFNEFVTNPYKVKGTICVKECQGVNTKAYECYPNSEIPSCGNIRYYPTVTFMERFCVADYDEKALKTIQGAEVSIVTAAAESVKDVVKSSQLLNKGIFKAVKFPKWQAAQEDIQDAWWIILIAVVMAFIFGYLYIFLMRYCARVIMYVMIVLFYTGIALIGYAFWIHGDNLEDGKDSKAISNPEYYKYAAYGVWFIGLIQLILLFCSCKSIETAINMLQVGAQFIQNNGCVNFLPMVWIVAYVGFLFYWICSSAYIASVGTSTHNKGWAYGTMKYDTETNVYLWLLVVSFFWNTANFLCSLNFVLATTCTLWYFSNDKNKDNGFVMTSINWLMFKHFGSVCLSSLLLAAVWVLQLVMRMIIAMLKSDDKAGENCLVICLVKMVTCCIDCFERCVQFISKQAYCEIAIRSCGYCSAACSSMNLYLQNAVAFALIDGAVECSTTIACFVISISCVLISSLIIENSEKLNMKFTETTSIKLVIFLVTLGISKMFMQPYDVACDTVMHCYAYNKNMAPKEFEIGMNDTKKGKYQELNTA